MKILNSKQMHELDALTMERQVLTSAELMERASEKLTEEIVKIVPKESRIKIFCGSGNNGGDGLCIARMLYNQGYDYVTAYKVKDFSVEDDFPEISEGDVVVDAIFGTGLNREITGLLAKLVEKINTSGARVIAVDIPSGLSDFSILPATVIKADTALKIHSPAVSMLLPENEDIVGELKIIDIGLESAENFDGPYNLLTRDDVKKMLKPRKKFSHKGTFGHSLLIAGEYLKGGAAVLAARACHRAGAGLVTVHTDEKLVNILQTATPETMLSIDELPDLEKFAAVGIGPGIGQSDTAEELVKKVLSLGRPAVFDADALNIISAEKLHRLIPKNSVLTPHVKEFERLFGKTLNSYERLELLRKKAVELKSVIVLKGAYSQIATPEGEVFFNSTGNPGMATAGSGDVLTGIITAFLSQKYTTVQATKLGVFVHGLAGDLTAEEKGCQGLIASDIIEMIPFALKKLA
ncbi:MAG: NAD(P)H-hydrate dehydratase [Bacteroidales bacterium]|jgi:NAD(P)H-hydrate epimerase|nr:NAD(P)H-hydrate dehydratase [Bacteroidales bacterium]